jgi:hypothetical protein
MSASRPPTSVWGSGDPEAAQARKDHQKDTRTRLDRERATAGQEAEQQQAR